VLINVPVNHEASPGEYDTIPLGMVVTPDYFVTICQEYNEVLQSFKGTRYRYFSTFKRTRFLSSCCTQAQLFLKDRARWRGNRQIEHDLDSHEERGLFQLLDSKRGLLLLDVAPDAQGRRRGR
jgi:magnesium transporter